VKVVLIDTNIVVRAVKGREPVLLRNIRESLEQGTELAVSAITVHEAQVGVLRNDNPVTAVVKHQVFMQTVKHYWDFTRVDGLLAAEIRLDLMKIGMQIGPFDALLAAQALNHGVSFITNNTREFGRVPGLNCFDWTKP
jgi:tRNA(fMet)-specific endonuclease VapC